MWNLAFVSYSNSLFIVSDTSPVTNYIHVVFNCWIQWETVCFPALTGTVLVISEVTRKQRAHTYELEGVLMPHVVDVSRYSDLQVLDYFPSDQHFLSPVSEHKKANKLICGYCVITGNKYSSGAPVKSYYKCGSCDVGLCRYSQDCFYRFHELRVQHPHETAKSVVRKLKPLPLNPMWQ